MQDSVTDHAISVVTTNVPATISGWQRFIKTHRTLNDDVEDVHKALLSFSDDEPVERTEERNRYAKFLNAVMNSQSIEGTVVCDDFCAAQMIREKAQRLDKNHPVNSEKIATISRALNVVLRRYHQDRETRRDSFAGKTAANGKPAGDNE